jgi:hypothetical protein
MPQATLLFVLGSVQKLGQNALDSHFSLALQYPQCLGEIAVKTPRHVLAAGVNLGIMEVPLLYDQQSGK